MSEFQIEGRHVVRWLSKNTNDAWGALRHVTVDDVARASSWRIMSIHKGGLQVVPAGSGRTVSVKSWDWLGAVVIRVPAHQEALRDAILASRDPVLEAAQERLTKLGFQADRLGEGDDVMLLDRVLSAAYQRRVVPSPKDRSAIFEAVKRLDQERPSVRYFRAWMEAIERHGQLGGDPLSRLHLAVLLRRSGAAAESVAVSEVIDWPRATGDIGQRLLLNRAAALMDLFQRNGGLERLQEAERLLQRLPQGSQAVEKAVWRLRSLKDGARKPRVGSAPPGRT